MSEADEIRESGEQGRKHLWPSWWDDIPHPNVPFPKFYEVLGDRPGPREILRRAKEYAREHGEG